MAENLNRATGACYQSKERSTAGDVCSTEKQPLSAADRSFTSPSVLIPPPPRPPEGASRYLGGVIGTETDPPPQRRTQDFLRGGGNFFPCIVVSRVRKNKLYVSYLPCCRLHQSSHITKSFKQQTSKMQITQFNGRNPENIVFFRSQGGRPPVEAPLPPPLTEGHSTWVVTGVISTPPPPKGASQYLRAMIGADFSPPPLQERHNTCVL